MRPNSSPFTGFVRGPALYMDLKCIQLEPCELLNNKMNPLFDRNSIKELARQIVDNEIGILAGSRKMVVLYHEQGSDDENFNAFRALDSETDDCLVEPIGFPISDSRREENSRKIKEYEDNYRSEVLNQCRLLLEDDR
jgi:hypothetical protein